MLDMLSLNVSRGTFLYDIFVSLGAWLLFGRDYFSWIGLSV